MEKPNIKVIKTSLHSFINNNCLIDVKGILNRVVLNSDTQFTYMTFFIKVFFTYLFDHHLPLPIIDDTYIVKIFVLISDGMCDDPELTNFYRRFCQHIMITSIDREGMNNVMNDNAKKYVTCFENNIKQHFSAHLDMYIETAFDLESHLLFAIDKNEKNRIKYEFRNIRNDIMNISESFNSDGKYHQFIIGTRQLIYPDNMPIKTKKGEIVTSIHYDITCRHQKYFRAMIHMTKFVEKTYADIYCYENNTNCDGYTNPIRLYNVFPLRTSIIPKYAPTFFQLMCQFRFATLTHLIVKA